MSFPKIFSLFVTCFSFVFVFSQTTNPFGSKCKEIHSIDSIIYQIDVNNKYDLQKIVKEHALNNSAVLSTLQKAEKDDQLLSAVIENLLLPILEIEGTNFVLSNFEAALDCIENVETITWLELSILNRVNFYDASTVDNINQSLSVLTDVHEIVKDKVNELVEEKYSMYGFTSSTDKWLKGVYVDHTNDVFFLGRYNDDRDLTGAFRLELYTDKLKMRLVKWLSTRNLYSYQSVFVGGEGYTPYLRDTTIFSNPGSFDTNDRPYGSFIYAGRAKYRISRKGRYRGFSQIKIGVIGSMSPYNIQGVLHRDVLPSSVNPNGWEAQIAAGGRIAVNYETRGEWLINLREDKDYKPAFDFLNRNVKVSVLALGSWGYEKTYLGAGIGISNKSFKERGGAEFDSRRTKPKNRAERLWNALTASVTLDYKYIQRNSLLEGYGVGLIGSFFDDYKDSPKDVYTLTESQMVRNIFTAQFELSIKFRYIGLIFKQTIMSPEFDLPVNSMAYDFGGVQNPDGVAGNHNLSPWNHAGTIGLIFIVE